VIVRALCCASLLTTYFTASRQHGTGTALGVGVALPASRRRHHAQIRSGNGRFGLHPALDTGGRGGRSRRYSRVVVNEDRCQGCFMFAMVCPLGAISAHPTKQVAVKCDRCTDREKQGQKGVNSDAGGLESKRSISLL